MGLNPDSTVLHYAAKHGFGQSVQAIVRKWKDGLECKNKAEETPLDLAPLYIRPLVKPGQLDSLRVMRQATVACECVRALAEYLLGCACACASRECGLNMFMFICGSGGWAGGGVEVEMMANRHAEDVHTCV